MKNKSETVNSFNQSKRGFKTSFKNNGKKRSQNISAPVNSNAPKNLSCLYTNADQLMNKRSELQALTDIHQPDIIGITEVKPKNT